MFICVIIFLHFWHMFMYFEAKKAMFEHITELMRGHDFVTWLEENKRLSRRLRWKRRRSLRRMLRRRRRLAPPELVSDPTPELALPELENDSEGNSIPPLVWSSDSERG